MYIYICMCKCTCIFGFHTHIQTHTHTHTHRTPYIHTHKKEIHPYRLAKCEMHSVRQIQILRTHTYMHTYIHTYIHTCMHAYIHTYIHRRLQCVRYKDIRTHRYMHTYIRHTYNMHTYIRHIYIHTYIHAYIHTTYIQHAYIHTSHIHTYMHTYIHTYIQHAYIHTYIHTTCIHTYIHTYRLIKCEKCLECVSVSVEIFGSAPGNEFKHKYTCMLTYTSTCVHTHTRKRVAGVGTSFGTVLGELSADTFSTVGATSVDNNPDMITAFFEMCYRFLCEYAWTMRVL